MKHLIKNWSLYKKIIAGKHLAFFLDYDGTLAPLASTPAKAVFPTENKTLLEILSRNKKYKVTIVSGRAIEDVRRKVGIKKLTYVGNHGLEIEGPQIRFESLLPPHVKQSVEQIKNELIRNLAKVPGVLLEDKGLTLSLHYRLVDRKNVPEVKKVFLRICKPYRQQQKIKIGLGKEVLEIRPPIEWNKGHAVSWLLKEYRLTEDKDMMPIYIGDDLTDEDAFRILRGAGLTIVVGQRPSRAQYYVQDTKEVTWVLEQILQLPA